MYSNFMHYKISTKNENDVVVEVRIEVPLMIFKRKKSYVFYLPNIQPGRFFTMSRPEYPSSSLCLTCL